MDFKKTSFGQPEQNRTLRGHLLLWMDSTVLSLYLSFATRVSQLKLSHFELLVQNETFVDALSTGIVS